MANDRLKDRPRRAFIYYLLWISFKLVGVKESLFIRSAEYYVSECRDVMPFHEKGSRMFVPFIHMERMTRNPVVYRADISWLFILQRVLSFWTRTTLRFSLRILFH